MDRRAPGDHPVGEEGAQPEGPGRHHRRHHLLPGVGEGGGEVEVLGEEEEEEEHLILPTLRE